MNHFITLLLWSHMAGKSHRAEERAVTIRGTKEAIDKAVKGIEEIIESRGR